MNFRDSYLSLTSFEERAVNEDDQNLSGVSGTFEEKARDKSLIYKESRFYHYRECMTCKIQRLPKSSHCGTCNNCVLGFDHHCTLLNNCVGKRNLRAFICLLMCAWTFYLLTGLAAAFAILYVPERDEYLFEGGIKLDYQSGISIAILVLQIVKFVLLCCLKHCVTFG